MIATYDRGSQLSLPRGAPQGLELEDFSFLAEATKDINLESNYNLVISLLLKLNG